MSLSPTSMDPGKTISQNKHQTTILIISSSSELALDCPQRNGILTRHKTDTLVKRAWGWGEIQAKRESPNHRAVLKGSVHRYLCRLERNVGNEVPKMESGMKTTALKEQLSCNY